MGYDVFASLEQSMMALWIEVVRFLPQVALAILVLIVGWIVGGVLGGVVRKLFRTLKLDQALDAAGVDELSKRAGHEFKPGHFAGALVKWFIILVFVVVAFDIMRLDAVTAFISQVVLGYLPLVLAAVLILFAAMLVANVASKALVATLRASQIGQPDLFGKIAYYLIIGFGIMAALNQLQIADELIETLFTAIVFALALALGLAFGLGGKDAAARYVNKLTKQENSPHSH